MMHSPTTMTTYTGKALDLAAPHHSAITLEDIAVGLTHTIRWRGTFGPMTVAQHSVICAHHHLLADNRAARRLALLHDAAEAYLGDVPSPAKHACRHGDFEALEGALMLEIARAMDLVPAWDRLVREVDLDVRAWEVYHLGPNAPWLQDGMRASMGPPTRTDLDQLCPTLPAIESATPCWAPHVAYGEFLACAHALGVPR
jgi:hypothetical protein